MRFDVGTTASGADHSLIPSTIVETNNSVTPSVSLLTARLRTVQAGEITSGMPQLGDAKALMNFTNASAATETPQLGSTEA